MANLSAAFAGFGAVKWQRQTDPARPTDSVIGRLYGRYVFYLLHHDGSAQQRALMKGAEAALVARGFNQWGLAVRDWPAARDAYLELCRSTGVTPEAAQEEIMANLSTAFHGLGARLGAADHIHSRGAQDAAATLRHAMQEEDLWFRRADAVGRGAWHREVGQWTPTTQHHQLVRDGLVLLDTLRYYAGALRTELNGITDKDRAVTAPLYVTLKAAESYARRLHGVIGNMARGEPRGGALKEFGVLEAKMANLHGAFSAVAAGLGAGRFKHGDLIHHYNTRRDGVRTYGGIARVEAYTPAAVYGGAGYFVAYLHPDLTPKQGIGGPMHGFVRAHEAEPYTGGARP
jgi:hypothetical protein